MSMNKLIYEYLKLDPAKAIKHISSTRVSSVMHLFHLFGFLLGPMMLRVILMCQLGRILLLQLLAIVSDSWGILF
jgi:hypothetical protein